MVVPEFLIDAYRARHGVVPSTLTLIDLIRNDWPELARRMAINRFPVLKPALKIFETDYHRDPDPELDLPVVFLRHGHSSGASSLKELGRVLEGYGINNHQYDYTDELWALIDRFTAKVEAEVELRERKVCAVGHSKGAIIILGAYQQRPDLFERIVTLTPPFYGSEKGHHFGKVRSLYNLRPESEAIQRLIGTPLPEDAPILNLYTDIDEFIEPPEHSILPEQNNITNIIFPGMPHNDFIRDPVVHQVVKLFLDGKSFDHRYMSELSDRLNVYESMRAEEVARANGFLRPFF
jgi:hypothetical protein